MNSQIQNRLFFFHFCGDLKMLCHTRIALKGFFVIWHNERRKQVRYKKNCTQNTMKNSCLNKQVIFACIFRSKQRFPCNFRSSLRTLFLLQHKKRSQRALWKLYLWFYQKKLSFRATVPVLMLKKKAGSRFNPHQVLGKSYGPNLVVTSLLVTFGSKIKQQCLTSGE